MTTFYTRRDGGAAAHRTAAAPRVGLVFLNTFKRRLYCLNATAREMAAEGVPMTAADLVRQPLHTLAGDLVRGDELPLVRAWREEAPVESTFVLNRPSGGTSQQVHWIAAPLRDAEEHVVGVSGSVTILAPEPDWQVMAGLAHDLRTPLQAMRLLSPLLGEAEVPPDVRVLSGRLQAAAERAMSVGMDLLEWCRGPAAGGRRVSRSWFALAPFLEGLTGEQEVNARRKNITLQTNVAAVAGWEAFTDPVRLGRLLANLLTNAIRYTNAGRVQFAASWRAAEPDRTGDLVIRVSDTGTGISAEDQESIFHPFERGKGASQADSSGSGVGLSVVDRLVEELGLTLDVFSEYGQGSRFDVLLPPVMLRRAEE
jgi:signal transduction histidine kinase